MRKCWKQLLLLREKKNTFIEIDSRLAVLEERASALAAQASSTIDTHNVPAERARDLDMKKSQHATYSRTGACTHGR